MKLLLLLFGGLLCDVVSEIGVANGCSFSWKRATLQSWRDSLKQEV